MAAIMSSVPFYAVNTSTRSYDSPKNRKSLSPPAPQLALQSKPACKSMSLFKPLSPPSLSLSLSPVDEERVRSSSFTSASLFNIQKLEITNKERSGSFSNYLQKDLKHALDPFRQ